MKISSLFLACCLHIAFSAKSWPWPTHNKPNMIIFLADDLGYGDLKSYGHPTQEWGPIDDLTKEGMKFTSMYSASALCSPSRAALLTGRLPIRTGAYGKYMNSYFASPNGLPKEEVTLPEALRDNGYATGMVGKWHLGINDNKPMSGAHLPVHHGFDWVGTNLPYSNVWECDESKRHFPAADPKNCFLYDNETIIQQPFSHDNLTNRFVLDAKAFIRNQSEKGIPFFLYVAFAHTHVAMFTGKQKKFTSKRGIYGESVQELSWAVGQIMDELKTSNIDDNTMVYFTSDNGAHIELCNEGGDNGILKGGKANYYEGGIRIPGIVRWPGHIQAGTINTNTVCQMDMYTTMITIGGAEDMIPKDRVIDGIDISDQILDTIPKSKIGVRALFFYCNDIMFAVRYGDYKIHYNTMPVKTKQEFAQNCSADGFPTDMYFLCLYCPSDCVREHSPPKVYNVEKDPGELYELDPTDYDVAKMLDDVDKVIKDHKANLKIGDAQYSSYDKLSKPCCDISKESCACNYP